MIEDREPPHGISKQAAPSGAERYPQPKRGRRIIMILFVTVAICGVVVPVLLANNGRNLEIAGDRLGLPLHDWWRGKTERVSLPPQSAPQPAPDGAQAPAPAHRAIPRPALENPPSHLSPPVEAWQPEKSCHALEPGETGEKPVFLAAPDGRSECTVLIALSHAEKASSLFLQVRAAGDNLSSLRMKLNFGEDGQQGVLTQKAGDLARRILSPISKDDRAYIQERMAERRAFRTEMGDYRMTFRAEGVDNSRFNFIAVSKIKEPAATAEEQGSPETEPQSAQP